MNPTPWKTDHDPLRQTIFIQDANGDVVEYFRDTEGGMEKAKLFAASPDLLKACEDFVFKVENGAARSVKSYTQMKEAINKAKGI